MLAAHLVAPVNLAALCQLRLAGCRSPLARDDQNVGVERIRQRDDRSQLGNWFVEITAGILGAGGRMAGARGLSAAMPKKVREVRVVLERNGWALVRQRGSHRHFRHPELPAVITLAGKPSSTVPPGILSSIRRLSGLEELR